MSSCWSLSSQADWISSYSYHWYRHLGACVRPLPKCSYISLISTIVSTLTTRMCVLAQTTYECPSLAVAMLIISLSGQARLLESYLVGYQLRGSWEQVEECAIVGQRNSGVEFVRSKEINPGDMHCLLPSATSSKQRADESLNMDHWRCICHSESAFVVAFPSHSFNHNGRDIYQSCHTSWPSTYPLTLTQPEGQT